MKKVLFKVFTVFLVFQISIICDFVSTITKAANVRNRSNSVPKKQKFPVSDGRKLSNSYPFIVSTIVGVLLGAGGGFAFTYPKTEKPLETKIKNFLLLIKLLFSLEPESGEWSTTAQRIVNDFSDYKFLEKEVIIVIEAIRAIKKNSQNEILNSGEQQNLNDEDKKLKVENGLLIAHEKFLENMIKDKEKKIQRQKETIQFFEEKDKDFQNQILDLKRDNLRVELKKITQSNSLELDNSEIYEKFKDEIANNLEKKIENQAEIIDQLKTQLRSKKQELITLNEF
ncbi:MAG: hypothetical protein LBJ32_01675 [Oscillospiraceae bacterium]|jgi:flagellar biosynthesis GTPase FlhF|nr:hypothetical protein [Oscillospiraceae bacterium]